MTTTTQLSITQLEVLCRDYARARGVLAERVTTLRAEVASVKRRRLPGIKTACAEAADLRDQLRIAIKFTPELFVKPRTFTLHGIKVGYQKGKGKLVWDDEEKVVKRILAMVPELDDDLFIETVQKPRKEALLTLDAATLKRLGCRIEGTDDQILVKSADSEVDKLVAQILEEGAKAAEEDAT